MPDTSETAPTQIRDAYAAAVILGCSVSDVGRCANATCQAYTHRYGRGATGPLCKACRAKAEATRTAR